MFITSLLETLLDVASSLSGSHLESSVVFLIFDAWGGPHECVILAMHVDSSVGRRSTIALIGFCQRLSKGIRNKKQMSSHISYYKRAAPNLRTKNMNTHTHAVQI